MTMADEKKVAKELVSIGMVQLHKDAKEWVVFGKRVCRGKGADGKVRKADLKVEFKAGVPDTDELATKWYGCTIKELVKKGILEKSHSLNKTDAQMGDYPGDVLVAGLAELATADFATVGRQPGAKAEEKAKAAKFDALKAKFGITDDAQIEAILAHAMAAQSKASKK